MARPPKKLWWKEQKKGYNHDMLERTLMNKKKKKALPSTVNKEDIIAGVDES